MNNRQITIFLIALILVGFLVELVTKISPNAGWGLAIIIILGMLVNNPLIIYWLAFQIQQFRNIQKG